MVLVLGIFHISKAWIDRKWLSRFTFLLCGRTNFSGYVPQIPVIHDVEDACKLCTVGVVIVDVIVDRNEPYTHSAKVYFSIESRFNIITPNTAHVLDQHRLDNAGFNVCQQLLPAGTIKVSATVTIICIVTAIGEAIIPGVCFQ